jgi:hypothetical protein
MPISLAKAREQAQGRAISKLGTTNEFEFFVASNILEQYGAEFKAELERIMAAREIVGATGDLMESINPLVDNEGKRLTITMLDYYDFVNEGVKGVKSSRNAPTSPYKFKNYGMSAEGRASIKQYILDGKAKVTDKKTMGRTVLGLERKGVQLSQKKSLIDRQVDTLIYNIKKYGIKKTDYFTDAFEKVFANWEQDMAEAFGEDVALSLQLKKK